MHCRDGLTRGRRIGCHDEVSSVRSGFTILELLVALAVIGVLVSVVLPAVGAAREAARRVQCTSHLRQIGLALHCYEDGFRCLPSGWQWEASGNTGFSWAVPLLPLLEQRAAYELIDRNRPVGDPANDRARDVSLALWLCPSDLATPTFELFGEPDTPWPASDTGGHPLPLTRLPTANYMGVFGTPEPDDSIPAPPGDGAFIESRGVRFAELQRGLSRTLLVGERTMARVPSTWLGVDFHGADAACRLVGNAATAPNCATCDECEFDSRHSGGANFLWADGHVSLIADTIDGDEYRRLARRSESE
jgi:prepilin-type processing-associated H-X9-DG protein/prepilin-type N-terminal cleavage/methylation domain-containing protein